MLCKDCFPRGCCNNVSEETPELTLDAVQKVVVKQNENGRCTITVPTLKVPTVVMLKRYVIA